MPAARSGLASDFVVNSLEPPTPLYAGVAMAALYGWARNGWGDDVGDAGTGARLQGEGNSAVRSLKLGGKSSLAVVRRESSDGEPIFGCKASKDCGVEAGQTLGH